MTKWSEVLSSAMTIIDDVRWAEQIMVNPAQFYRAKSQIIKLSLTLLNKPAELLNYLTTNMEEPKYDDGEWVTTDDSLNDVTVIETDKIGYDLCSFTVRSEDGREYYPYVGAEYDSETGRITFPKQEETGIVYSYDLYKDGEFQDLSASQMRLLILAISIVWDERFERNWLNIQPKIKDASFETVNEANFMDKSNLRLRENRLAFESELRKYEQNTEYLNVVGIDKHMKLI